MKLIRNKRSTVFHIVRYSQSLCGRVNPLNLSTYFATGRAEHICHHCKSKLKQQRQQQKYYDLIVGEPFDGELRICTHCRYHATEGVMTSKGVLCKPCATARCNCGMGWIKTIVGHDTNILPCQNPECYYTPGPITAESNAEADAWMRGFLARTEERITPN